MPLDTFTAHFCIVALWGGMLLVVVGLWIAERLDMYGEPEDDKQIICDWCNHETTIGECRKVRYSSPFDYHKSGREGYHYMCPKCNKVAYRWYWKVS